MPHFTRPPSLLKKISENSDPSDTSEDEIPQSLSMLYRNIHHTKPAIGSWKDGFDTFEDYSVPGTGTYRIYSAGTKGPLVFCLHGAGASGLSFALLAKNVKSFCRLVAPDLRGHGHSVIENEKDLSASTLTEETILLINHVLPNEEKNKRIPIVLIGHSMGGGLAVQVAIHPSIRERIKGLIVVDVVEGTALESLQVMTNVLKKRPHHFFDYQEAIDWSLDSHLLQNRASAQISIPDQLVERDGLLYWRTNLFETEPYWVSWYKDMSKHFLEAPAVKMLLLAGRERLDTTLTIGQMQGKFQMVLMNGCGHYIHEDAPEEIGMSLQKYLMRYNLMGDKTNEEALRERIQRERAMLY